MLGGNGWVKRTAAATFWRALLLAGAEVHKGRVGTVREIEFGKGAVDGGSRFAGASSALPPRLGVAANIAERHDLAGAEGEGDIRVLRHEDNAAGALGVGEVPHRFFR